MAVCGRCWVCGAKFACVTRESCGRCTDDKPTPVILAGDSELDVADSEDGVVLVPFVDAADQNWSNAVIGVRRLICGRCTELVERGVVGALVAAVRGVSD